jgi:hypothetical protein
MPKLDTFQTLERLAKYINSLEAGEDVALRDIKAILNWVGDEYVEWIDEEKERQRELKKKKRARTEQEAKQYGHKSIQEILNEALQRAKTKLQDEILERLDEEQKKATVRQARIYLDAYSEARKQDKSEESARDWANNELTRAGLRRLDGVKVNGMNKRDKQVCEMEDALEEKFYNEMTEYEREQYDMLHEAKGEVPRWRERKAKKNTKK